MYDYTNLTFVCESLMSKPEVTGSHLTQAKKTFFLCMTGLGCYRRQPTLAIALAKTEVSRYQRAAGQN